MPRLFLLSMVFGQPLQRMPRLVRFKKNQKLRLQPHIRHRLFHRQKEANHHCKKKQGLTVGTARTYVEPVKLFLAVLATPATPWDQVAPLLTQRFGAIDFSTTPQDFAHTDYYRDEMGAPQQRFYLTFSPTVDRDVLAAAKQFTNDLEARFSHSGKRTINLDPGYLGREKLVLASTKDFFHRIYLRDGIYAEVTLAYRKGRFQYFSWTYPDYREPALHDFLQKPRAVLVTELRRTRA